MGSVGAYLLDGMGRTLLGAPSGEVARLLPALASAGRQPWEHIDDDAARQVRSEVAQCVTYAERRTFFLAPICAGMRLRRLVDLRPVIYGPARLLVIAAALTLDFDRLSTRQRQVLGHLAAGRTATQTAQRLGVGVSTIETHAARAREALGLSSWAELLAHVSGFRGNDDG